MQDILYVGRSALNPEPTKNTFLHIKDVETDDPDGKGGKKKLRKKNDYDYRLPEDRLSGKGYRIRCNSCGMSTLSSHDRYYPFCGPDTVTPFVSERIDLNPYVQVTYRVSGTFVVKVPVCTTGLPVTNKNTLLEIEQMAERMADAIFATGFGQLGEIEREVMSVTGPGGEDLLKKTEA